MIGVDTHAHVFHRGLPLAEGRRYTPAGDATWQRYADLLDRHGIGRALLVQPSFLGTDNSYLLEAVRHRPDRFRAVVVLDPGDPHAACAAVPELHAQGVRGIRLNLVGLPVVELDRPEWRALGRRMAEFGWHLELQASGRQWADLAEPLRAWPGAVVIDHVGLPRGIDDPLWQAVFQLAALPHVWVKVSGFYRSPHGAARAATRRLRDAVGVDRLLWGSDWPWTQHEEGRDYGALLAELRELVPEAERVLADNPARLLNWDT